MDSKKYNLNLDSEEEVSRLLTALPRVDAPSKFDFEVRARIASRKQPSSWLDRIPFTVRFALPTLLVLLFGAYLYFYQAPGYFGPEQDLNVAALPVRAPGIEEQAPKASTPTSTADELASQQEATPITRGTQGRGAAPATKQNSKVPQGGSKDFALDNPQSVDGPGARDPRKAAGVGPDGSQLSVKQLLSPMGIDTVFENGGWKVVVVTANSPAMRSGIIKGDIVTAIGNQPLNQNSSFRKASASHLTVMRDGKPVSIRVQPD